MRAWAAAPALALAVLAGGCGLKAGVAKPPGNGATPGGPASPGATSTPLAGAGQVAPDGAAAVRSPASGGAAAPLGSPAGPGPGTTAAVGVDVARKVIRVGLHVPITGAGLSQSSFARAIQQFWAGHRPLGYRVEVDLLDDQGWPSVARQRCEQAAKRDFFVVGVSWADEMAACATDRLLHAGGVPYLSLGGRRGGIDPATYLSLSMPYADQAELVVRNLKDQGAFAGRWAIVAPDGRIPEVVAAAQAALARHGAAEVRVFESTASLAADLVAYRAPIVYLADPRLNWGSLVAATATSQYFPIWTGAAEAVGLGTGVPRFCQDTGGRFDGRFLHVTPGPRERPAEFAAAGLRDETELLLWGVSWMIHDAIAAIRGPLTRANLVATLERTAIGGRPGGLPVARYTRADHFGGEGMWSLRSSCTDTAPDGRRGVYRTVGTKPLS